MSYRSQNSGPLRGCPVSWSAAQEYHRMGSTRIFKFFLAILVISYCAEMGESASERLFAANVGNLVDARLDPLVNPGTCSSHVHSVFGNAMFAADLTPEMLLDPTGDWRNIEGKFNSTTSELIPNLSMYWAPSLYIVDNQGIHHLVPTFVRPYYRITLRGDGDTSRIHPFPPFLRIILGDASRKSHWQDEETDRDDIRWTLRTINRGSTDYLQHGDWKYLENSDELPNIDAVEMKLQFPECLAIDANGDPLTGSPDWRSHAHYSIAWDRTRQSFCPESHPYQIPLLDLEVRYVLDPMRELLGVDHVNNVSNWVFSSGDKSGAGGHADFVNGWPTELMANMIANCTDGTSRGGRECFLDQFVIDGREDKQVPFDTSKIPVEQIDKLEELIIGTEADGVPCSFVADPEPTTQPTSSPTSQPTSAPPIACSELSRWFCKRTPGCTYQRPNCLNV